MSEAKSFCGGVHAPTGERKVAVSQKVDPNTSVEKYAHHWMQGRPGVEVFENPIERPTTEGNLRLYRYRFLVYLDPELPGTLTYDMVRERLKQVWQSERGWYRAGLRIAFTPDPSRAACTVRIASNSDGNEGCSNCTSCSCVHSRSGSPDRMYILEGHLQSDFVLNHEMGHAAFAFCDMYLKDTPQEGAGGYGGVMDVGTDATTWPTEHDVFDAREWLEGRARFASC